MDLPSLKLSKVQLSSAEMQITHRRVWGHEENIRPWCLDAFQFEELQTKTTLKNAYEEAFNKKRICSL